MSIKTHCHPSDQVQEDQQEELLVFGYSSKVFRDDEKAEEMELGKHLISWMGDENLKIDRYDVRGYLNDLSQYEEKDFDYTLTAEDKHVEELCDDERYRALLHSHDEQEMYKEEEVKRLKQSLNSVKEYSQVSYQYTDSYSEPETPNASHQTSKRLDKPFYPNHLLNMPANIILPSSENLNQIIEKTAYFVAEHGRQVEIIIKTRQAENENFQFLNCKSDLNAYYEYILNLMKSGIYKYERNEASANNPSSDIQSHPDKPILSYNVESAPVVPHVDYKPSNDCPYNMLVNKINNSQNSD